VLGNKTQHGDWKKEKHVPVIDCPDKVRADELFEVKVSLGKEIAHPNTMERKEPLAVGSEAPDFALQAAGGKTIHLREYRGSKNVVLAFHPLAWTSGCAAEMQALDDAMPQFGRLNTQVLGISVDSVPSKKAWAESLGIESFRFVSDFWPHGEVAKRYGVLREEGFAERAIFVIDMQGVIRFAKVYPVKEVPPMEEVLEAAQALETR